MIWCFKQAWLSRCLATLFILNFVHSVHADLPSDEREFFENRIRPILAQHCYECHNSLNKKKGGLALDYKTALEDGGNSGAVIVPGKPDQSVLILSIRHENDMKMPSKRPKLEDKVIHDFEKWVAMGAPDPRIEKPSEDDLKIEIPWEEQRDQRAGWWSFQPVRDHEPPLANDPAWNNSAIDQFVYHQMKREGLVPQAVAAPEILVRRVHLILTGLPPSPDIVKAFVEDPSPEAYERLVDNLLASTAFGQRWARHWMDWYRYAESHGSEGDPPIPYAQAYRDYLIRALNADVPYNQLLREHLAGDLLTDPRINKELAINESAIGPAHLRMVPHGYGVTDAYQEQIAFTDNQIDVISKAMLGVTVSCARCHDHKFDPISQKDFYRFYGIMIGSRPSTVLIDTSYKLETNKRAIVNLKQDLRRSFAQHWLTQIDKLPSWLDKNEQAIEKQLGFNDPLGAWNYLKNADSDDFPALIKDHSAKLDELHHLNQTAIKDAAYYLDLRDPANADKWNVTGNSSADAVSPAGAFALWASGEQAIRGIFPQGIYTHLISDKHAAVFTSEDVYAGRQQGWIHAAGVDNAEARVSVRNYPLPNGLLHPSKSLNATSLQWIAPTTKWIYWKGEKVHFELRTANDRIARAPSQDRSWFGVTEIHIGDHSLQSEGAPLISIVSDPMSIQNRSSLEAAYIQALRHTIITWRDGKTTDVGARFLNEFVQNGFLTNRISDLPASLARQIQDYRNLEDAIPIPRRAPGLIDGDVVDQPMLIRGDHKQEGDPVRRGFLELFDDSPYGGESTGRLELANDIVSEKNPLKTRALMNRLWMYVFGRGLAASTDNLGRLGSEPTHPELLDFLCVDFERNGWSIKHALRQMVTSRTFKSASMADAAALEQDPMNLYLSHFAPRRLDAEAIYDSIQFVQGQPGRAIYKPVIRNQLDSFLSTFNAPVPTSTVSRRDSTNVPAQSLTMMNGRLVDQAAQRWAEAIQRDTSLTTSEDRINAMYMQAFARGPSSNELEWLTTYLTSSPANKNELEQLTARQDQLKEHLATVERARRDMLAPIQNRLQRDIDKRNKERQEAFVADLIDLKPIARWDFEGDAQDAIGNAHGQLVGDARIENGTLVINGGFMLTKPINKQLTAKTLEVLVQLNELDQRGGGAMTVQTIDGNLFDSVVFGEKTPGHWLAGSNHFQRTTPFAGMIERDAVKQPVRMLIVYEENGTIRAYRNGKPYGKSYRTSAPFKFRAGETQVLFGLRHGTGPTNGRMLLGRIFEARLYDRALSAEEAIAASSGEIMEVVTREQIVAELNPDQQRQLADQDSTIVRLERDIRLLEDQLEEIRRLSGRGGGLAGIAHALLNSEEFIYVY